MPKLIVRLVSGIVLAVVVVASLGCGDGLSEKELEDALSKLKRQNDEAIAEVKRENDESLAELERENDETIAEIKRENDEAIREIEGLHEEALALRADQDERALVRTEARVQDIVDNHRTHLDEQMMKVREYIEYETDDIWAKTNESNKETLETIRQYQHDLVKSICETDYWVTTVVGMLSAMIRDGATTEELEGFFAGALIDDDYATYSGVCQADGDQRWQLISQPVKIPPNRFE